ncbi:hypothetical protein HDU67_001710, partial [Dinochytrium kinnereticum]
MPMMVARSGDEDVEEEVDSEELEVDVGKEVMDEEEPLEYDVVTDADKISFILLLVIEESKDEDEDAAVVDDDRAVVDDDRTEEDEAVLAVEDDADEDML